jgi:hypothetical protein
MQDLEANEMRTKSKPVKEKPAADIEEVKRRFTRQNRDLARANSTQALHIQNLKHEVEKLVAQNQDLKEMILRLQGELGTSRAQASSVRAKIAELNGLVASVYAQEDDGDLLSSQVIMSPTPRQFRERQPLAELMQETQMPTIAEHKSYPRRTLDGEDVFALRLSEHSSNGSPDLGPPPVAHFDGLEPIAYANDQETAAEKISEAVKKADAELLLASVETRRKRKDGPSKLEMRRSSILALSPVKNEADTTSNMLRTGAKRKLADREAEKPQASLNQDDFTFSRRSPVEETPMDEEPAVKISWPVSTAASPPRPARRALGTKDVNISPRKATVAKSDKPSKSSLPDLADVRKSRGENAISSRRSRASITSQQQSPPRARSKPALPSPPAEDAIVPPVHDIILDDVAVPEASVSYPPKTPAAPEPDLFSPPSSQHLNAGPRPSRDTPPPAEVGTCHSTLATTSSTEDANATARPSRRARSAVNYAEPSLVAKMRRPGKEMVDAISGLQDPRCVMSSTSGEGRKSVGGTVIAGPASASGTPASSSSTVGAMRRMVVIKTELMDEDAGDVYNGVGDAAAQTGNEPGSPLNSKSTTSSALSETRGLDVSTSLSSTRPSSTTVSAGRRRRDSTQAGLKSSATANVDEDEDDIDAAITLHNPRSRTITIPPSTSRTSTKPPSTTSSSSSHPMTTSSQPTPEEVILAARQRAEELDLYDFKETSSSSPAESSLSGAGASSSRSGSGGGEHRRSSSASSSSSSTAALAARTLTKQHRRHSSVPKDLNSTGAATGGVANPAVSVAAAGVEGVRDVSAMGGGLMVGSGIAGRAERVAARRRSMMI